MNHRRTPRVGADRWLVSYADFTTLLLAFFMALYTVSEVDQAKLAAATSSLRAAFDTPEGANPEATEAIPPTDNPPSVREGGSPAPTKPDAKAAVRERALAIGRRRELILEAVVALRGRMHPRLLAQTMRGMSPAVPAVDASGRVASALHIVSAS